MGNPAKVIRAKNGDIHIDAMNGDIVLKGANIRLQATDSMGEVTVNAGKQVATRACNSIHSCNSDKKSELHRVMILVVQQSKLMQKL